MGIEPTLLAWEARVLPLNYTRKFTFLHQATHPAATTATMRKVTHFKYLTIISIPPPHPFVHPCPAHECGRLEINAPAIKNTTRKAPAIRRV